MEPQGFDPAGVRGDFGIDLSKFAANAQKGSGEKHHGAFANWLDAEAMRIAVNKAIRISKKLSTVSGYTFFDNGKVALLLDIQRGRAVHKIHRVQIPQDMTTLDPVMSPVPYKDVFNGVNDLMARYLTPNGVETHEYVNDADVCTDILFNYMVAEPGHLWRCVAPVQNFSREFDPSRRYIRHLLGSPYTHLNDFKIFFDNGDVDELFIARGYGLDNWHIHDTGPVHPYLSTMAGFFDAIVSDSVEMCADGCNFFRHNDVGVGMTKRVKDKSRPSESEDYKSEFTVDTKSFLDVLDGNENLIPKKKTEKAEEGPVRPKSVADLLKKYERA